MTYFPKKGSLRDRVCQVMIKHGEPMSARQIADIFKGERASSVFTAVNQLKFYGALSLDKGFYELLPHTLQHYGVEVEMPVKEEIVAAPKASFKPWPGKFSFANAPRREPIRDASFLNGSIGFSYGF